MNAERQDAPSPAPEAPVRAALTGDLVVDTMRRVNAVETDAAMNRALTRSTVPDGDSVQRRWAEAQRRHGQEAMMNAFLEEVGQSEDAAVEAHAERLQESVPDLAQGGPRDPLARQWWDDIYERPAPVWPDPVDQVHADHAGQRQIRRLERTMASTDNVEILMRGVDFVFDALTYPGDKTRLLATHTLGIDVDPRAVADRRISAKELLEAMFPALGPTLNPADFPDWDDAQPPMENVMVMAESVTAHVAAMGLEVGADFATDPLAWSVAAITSPVSAAKKSYEVLKDIFSARVHKAQQASAKPMAPPTKPAGGSTPDGRPAARPVSLIDQANIKLKARARRKSVARKRADRVRSAETAADDSVDTIMRHVLEGFDDDIGRRMKDLDAGKSRTIEQARQEALTALYQDTLLVTVQEAKRLARNTPINDMQSMKFRYAKLFLARAVRDTARQAVRAGVQGNEELKAALAKRALEQLNQIQHIHLAHESGVSAVGRSLRIQQERVTLGSATFDVDTVWRMMQREQQKYPEGGMALIRSLATLDDPMTLARVGSEATGPTFFDRYQSLLVNSLLSNPATHVLNTATGVMAFAYGGLQRLAAGLGRNPFARNQRVGDVRDAMHYLWGGLSTIPEAVYAVGRSAVAGRGSLRHLMAEGAEKIDDPLTNALALPEATGPEGAIKRFIRRSLEAAGRVAGSPVAAMLAMDKGVQHVLANAEFRYLVSQMADEVIQGHGHTLAKRQQMRKEFLETALQNPQHLDVLRQEALAHAQDGVFTTRLTGAQRKFEEMRGAWKPLQLGVIFYKAIANLGNYEIRRVPGLQYLSAEFRRQLKSPDPRVRQLAHGNLALGWTTLLSGVQLAESGRIIGRQPADPKQAAMMRSLGIEPYSLVFDTNNDGTPDRWVSYKNWGVFGTLLGLSANLVQSQGYWDFDDATQATFMLAASTAELMLDKTIAESVHRMGDTMVRFMGEDEKLAAEMERLVMTYSLLNPKIVSFVEQVENPTVSDPDGVWERLMSKTPWASSLVPTQRDILGDPIYAGFLSPGTTDVLERTYLGLTGTVAMGKQLTPAQERALEIMEPLVRLNINVAHPQREFGDLVLTKTQMDRYNDAFYQGVGTRNDGPLGSRLIEGLAHTYGEWLKDRAQESQALRQAQYEQWGLTPDKIQNTMPTAVLQSAVSSLVTRRMQAAFQWMLQHEDEAFQRRVRAAKKQRAEVKAGRLNPLATSPGGRPVEDVRQDFRRLLDVPESSATTMTPDQAMQFQIGGAMYGPAE